MDFKNHSSIMKYVKEFYEFEQYINDMNLNLHESFEKHRGYLINLELIDRIKDKINYYTNKRIFKNNASVSFYDDKNKYYTIEEIKFRNADYLLNMIFNGNKYIMINRNLWKLLCKENEEDKEPIIYEINYSKIKFKLNDGNELIFSKYENENNIIKNELFYYNCNPQRKLYESKFSNIKNDFKKIFEFYQYQKKFLKKLQSTNKTSLEDGYLADINWFNTWNNYFDYSNLKNNYFDKVEEKEILNHLIYIHQLNENKHINLSPPKILKFPDKNALSEYLSKYKLIVINSSLISSTNDLNYKYIYYYLYNNKIEFYFDYQNSLILNANDNIISTSKNNNNNNNNKEYSNIRQIFRIFYFRKFLKGKILKENKISLDVHSMILINKELIDYFISYFDYEILSEYMKSQNIEYNNLEQKFEVLINNLKISDIKLFNELEIKEKSFAKINFNGIKKDFLVKNYNIKGKNLFYISNFEIIDDSIYNFFIENEIIKDNNGIKGEYLAGNGKIFLCYEYIRKNIYQIGTINDNGNFIPEYLIDGTYSTKSQIVKKFSDLGIKIILNNMIDDKVTFENHYFIYCYKISNNEISIEDNKNLLENGYSISNIVLFLMSLYIFEEEIKRQLFASKGLKSNYSFITISCNLINMNFITEIKKLFNYQKIKEFIDLNKITFSSQINEVVLNNFLRENENYKNYLEMKKKDFLELKQKGKLINVFDKKSFKNGNAKFDYPVNFNIIEIDLFNKFLNILNINENQLINKPKEISLTFNSGKIVLSDSDEGSRLYIYSYDEKKEINYYPELILDFKTFENLNNNFKNIIKEDFINKILNGEQQNMRSNYNCNIYLINSQYKGMKETEDISNSDLNNNNKNKECMKLLSVSFRFTYEYMNYYNFLKSNQSQNIEESIYLINKKYIDEIKSISLFEEISVIIKMKKEIIEKFKNSDVNYLDKLKECLTKKSFDILNNLTKKEIELKLENKNLFDKSAKHYNNYLYNDLYYYENFQIIDKNLLEIMKYYDNNLAEKCIEVKAIFSSNKIILLLNENEKYVINVGQINSDDVFELGYLIQEKEQSTKTYFELKKIFESFKTKGYYYVKNCIKNNQLELSIENIYTVKAMIYRLLNGGNPINTNMNNNYFISGKLKAMILLSISQNIDIDKFHKYIQKKNEKVYLMNYNFLLEYKYSEVFQLIKENKEIKNLVDQMNDPINPYDANILEQILSKLNKDQLMEIDKSLQDIDLTQCSWEAKPEIILNKGKNIKAYKEFVLVREKVFKEIEIKLNLSSSMKEFYYTYNDGDIISIDNGYEHLIYFGKINIEEHLFSLRYNIYFAIFYFNYYYYLYFNYFKK